MLWEFWEHFFALGKNHENRLAPMEILTLNQRDESFKKRSHVVRFCTQVWRNTCKESACLHTKSAQKTAQFCSHVDSWVRKIEEWKVVIYIKDSQPQVGWIVLCTVGDIKHSDQCLKARPTHKPPHHDAAHTTHGTNRNEIRATKMTTTQPPRLRQT